MLYDEFLKGIGKQASEAMAYAYKVINKMYMDEKLKSKLEAYGYYSQHQNDFNWIDDLNIGHGWNAKKSDGLTTIITEEEAKKIINEEFCFEIDKMEICGTPYFEVYDYNHICFMVKGYPRVYNNGMLYDIHR